MRTTMPPVGVADASTCGMFDGQAAPDISGGEAESHRRAAFLQRYKILGVTMPSVVCVATCAVLLGMALSSPTGSSFRVLRKDTPQIPRLVGCPLVDHDFSVDHPASTLRSLARKLRI
jgi:hypothetical protein